MDMYKYLIVFEAGLNGNTFKASITYTSPLSLSEDLVAEVVGFINQHYCSDGNMVILNIISLNNEGEKLREHDRMLNSILDQLAQKQPTSVSNKEEL